MAALSRLRRMRFSRLSSAAASSSGTPSSSSMSASSESSVARAYWPGRGKSPCSEPEAECRSEPGRSMGARLNGAEEAAALVDERSAVVTGWLTRCWLTRAVEANLDAPAPAVAVASFEDLEAALGLGSPVAEAFAPPPLGLGTFATGLCGVIGGRPAASRCAASHASGETHARS